MKDPRRLQRSATEDQLADAEHESRFVVNPDEAA